MPKGKDLFQYILGGLIVAGFFVFLIFLVLSNIPEANKDILNLVTGALIGNFGLVVGYYYGSSKSSASKDEVISQQLSDKNDLLLKKEGDTL